ncbi:MAG: hypothetical protein RQ745_05690 [Longimicrobiales bacterium]|nr:hypothetical protein [Longimicrobiales bacterium]
MPPTPPDRTDPPDPVEEPDLLTLQLRRAELERAGVRADRTVGIVVLVAMVAVLAFGTTAPLVAALSATTALFSLTAGGWGVVRRRQLRRRLDQRIDARLDALEGSVETEAERLLALHDLADRSANESGRPFMIGLLTLIVLVTFYLAVTTATPWLGGLAVFVGLWDGFLLRDAYARAARVDGARREIERLEAVAGGGDHGGERLGSPDAP